jgi:hypothetical protein
MDRTKASHRRTITHETCYIVSAEKSSVEHTLVLRFLQDSHATGTTCARWGIIAMVVRLERLSVKRVSCLAAS